MTTLGASQTAFIPFVPPQSIQNGSSQTQASTPKQNPAPNGTASPVAGPSTSTATSTSAASSGQRKTARGRKRTLQEDEVAAQTATRFAARLAADQQATLKPEVDTPFADVEDAVRRLLPYHIYQQPKGDLEKLISRKGKGKAEEVDLRSEIEDTKFALECHKRKRALRDRLHSMRVREGKREAPADQAFFLEQAVCDAERAEIAWMNAELRSARAELDRRERTKREAQAAAQRSSAAPMTSTFYVPPATAPQSQYYQYPYTFSQTYGSAQPLTFQPYMPHAPYASTPTNTSATGSPAPTLSTPAAVPSPAPTTTAPGAYASYYQQTQQQAFHTSSQSRPQMTPATPSVASTATAPAASAPPVPPSGTFPVHVPITFLPALHAVGIHPISPGAVLPGHPKPAAIVKGATADGQTLILEINIAALQQKQLSGLSLVINKMVETGKAAAASGSSAVAGGSG